jgi:TusA-related sulfurtransferase/DNA-binding transcriptional ArsR family regulator
MEMKPLNVNARRAATLLKALANENRLRILCELLDGERCVNELEKVVGLSQSALSQHLARLRRDELVRTCRVGKTICYSLNGQEAPVVLQTLYRLFCAGDADTAAEPLVAANGELEMQGDVPSPSRASKAAAWRYSRVSGGGARTTIDARDAFCPAPMMELIAALKQTIIGDEIEILSRDKSSTSDIRAWTRKAGHRLVSTEQRGDHWSIVVKKVK